MPGFGRGFTARMPALMGYSGGSVMDACGALVGLTSARPGSHGAGLLAQPASADLDGLARPHRQVFVASHPAAHRRGRAPAGLGLPVRTRSRVRSRFRWTQRRQPPHRHPLQSRRRRDGPVNRAPRQHGRSTMIISNILQAKGSNVIAVRPDDTAVDVVRTLAQHRIGAVLVRDAAGAVLGIVSERDIVRCMASSAETVAQEPARMLMTKVLHTVSPRTLIVEALAMMTDRRVRHLPVLDEQGELAGMVSIGDLVKARIAEAELEANELRNYVSTAG
jgi:CBS domain-containing protein